MHKQNVATYSRLEIVSFPIGIQVEMPGRSISELQVRSCISPPSIHSAKMRRRAFSLPTTDSTMRKPIFAMFVFPNFCYDSGILL